MGRPQNRLAGQVGATRPPGYRLFETAATGMGR